MEVTDSGPCCKSGYNDLHVCGYDTLVLQVSGSGPGC